MLSKFITANSLEAIAAPEMNTRARVRRNEAVFCTVDGARFDGNEYASVMLAKTNDGNFLQPSAFHTVGVSASGTVCWGERRRLA